ncbi:ABC transporter substrate-binding protein [Candidatus Entotheonella palauensis]|uniref:ABC transporter substrate-binding protein n=1 Tax=Candidatus Entotheonella palauensis TaxID=93172 RepID=UPI0015C4ABCF|nr:ABC transporter substrate-binding protein [Candidatus Entotheonella palauensis]
MRVWSLKAVILLVLWAVPWALAEETPRYGGILKVAIAGDPPSLDIHQERTFKVQIPMMACYNTLLHYTPGKFPEISCDLCTGWTVSDDHLAYTFTLHQGVTFHDGSELTAADVKISWEKIIWPDKVFPGQRVIATHKAFYLDMVDRIEAPEPYTVVFHLKRPSASFLPLLAHPARPIYAKTYLEQDPHYYRKKVMGTGPFQFKKYVRGSYLELERNPAYWVKGRPYLDGVKYFMIKDLSARAKSVRSGRTDVEFRSFPPSEVEAMKNQLGDRIVAADPKPQIYFGIAINADQEPFNDERVRQALSLAIDRHEMARTILPLTGLGSPGGGLMHPDSKWAVPPEELQQLPGFGLDYEASLKEAKRLLAEAGYPTGFKTVLHNRAVKLPYIDFGVYVISAWKKIGVQAEHKLVESATWIKDLRTRNFALAADPGSSISGDPDEHLVRWISDAPNNYGRYRDRRVDELFRQQSREIDEAKRIDLVREMQKTILGKVWWLQGLWWRRLEVRSARIRGYEPNPHHWDNRRLQDVWLAEK